MTSVSIGAPDKELSDLLDFSAVRFLCFVLMFVDTSRGTVPQN